MLFGKAKKKDLKVALKKLQKLQGIKTNMFFPDLKAENDWKIVGYGDAGIKSLPDKLSSCGGQVVLQDQQSCILKWKKLVRKVASLMAGEALALVAVIGSCVYFKSLLKDMFGSKIDKIPIVVYTDSRNLFRAVHTTSMVDDDWLIVDIV